MDTRLKGIRHPICNLDLCTCVILFHLFVYSLEASTSFLSHKYKIECTVENKKIIKIVNYNITYHNNTNLLIVYN
jgi:hypothetical protein